MSYQYQEYSGDKINNLHNRTIQLVKPGVFIKHTNYNKDTYGYNSQLSMFSNHVLQDTNIYQHYGFSSAPLAGTKAIVLGINGSNTNNVVIGTHDDRYQPNDLKAGEVSLHDYQGQSVELRQNQTVNITGQKTIYVNIGDNKQIIITDGSIEITGNVTIDKDVTINGKLHVKGQITSDDDVLAGSISLKSHTHTSGQAGSPTSSPI